MKRVLVALLPILVVSLALGACGGQSKSDKAKNTVCDARADINKQVNELKALTPSTVTVDGVQKNLKAISDDLSKIAGAQSDLSGDRKQQVQDANKAFTTQVKDIAGSLGTSTSLSSAKSQLTTALNQLADAYKQTFAKISC